MRRKVLIAEDEPNIVESLSFILDKAGFDVRLAGDGESAFQAAADTPPDVMVLDVMMPRMNGFDVLRQLRAHPTLHALPVVILTAKGQAQDRRTAMDAGASAFITKPFSNADVVETVRRLAGG